MDEKNIEGMFSIAKDKLLMCSVYAGKLNYFKLRLKIKNW